MPHFIPSRQLILNILNNIDLYSKVVVADGKGQLTESGKEIRFCRRPEDFLNSAQQFENLSLTSGEKWDLIQLMSGSFSFHSSYFYKDTNGCLEMGKGVYINRQLSVYTQLIRWV